jgi:hypothetical protein
MDRGRQVNGLSSGRVESLSFVIAILSDLIRRQHEVAIDDHADREAGTDRKGRLDVEVAAYDLLAGLVERVAAAAPERRYDRVVVVGGSELRANAEQGRKRGRHEQPAPVLIHLILESGKSLRVGTGLALEHDGAPVRHDQARPDQEQTVLSKRNLAVVEANELRSLRNEQISAGRAVIDMLGQSPDLRCRNSS